MQLLLSKPCLTPTAWQGIMYLQVDNAAVQMATELQGLVVLPHEAADSATALTCALLPCS